MPRPHTEPVLRLDRVERAGAAVAGVLARRPRVAGAPLAVRPTTPAPVAPWLDEVAALLGAPEGTLGDHDRARLLAARAGVLLAGSADQAGAGHGDATVAAACSSAPATCCRPRPPRRRRSGGRPRRRRGPGARRRRPGPGRLRVASDGERDPDGEAGMTEMLGRLCEQSSSTTTGPCSSTSWRSARCATCRTTRRDAVRPGRIADLLLHRTDPGATSRAQPPGSTGPPASPVACSTRRPGRRRPPPLPVARCVRRGPPRRGLARFRGPRRTPRGTTPSCASPAPAACSARARRGARRPRRGRRPCSPPPATSPGRSPRSSSAR